MLSCVSIIPFTLTSIFPARLRASSRRARREEEGREEEEGGEGGAEGGEDGSWNLPTTWPRRKPNVVTWRVVKGGKGNIGGQEGQKGSRVSEGGRRTKLEGGSQDMPVPFHPAMRQAQGGDHGTQRVP